MRRTALVVAGALFVCAVTLIPAPSVRATGVCAGSGSMSTGAPMFYPVTPLNPPTVRQPVTTSFGFSLVNLGGTCVNTTGAVTTQKGFSATGTLSGWCGLLSGAGAESSTGERFAFVSAGGVVVFTGAVVGLALITDTAEDRCNGCCSTFGGTGSD